MALLVLLSDLGLHWDLDLKVLYCHHGLRVAADEEAAFVRTWARKKGCSFFTRKLAVREFQKERGMSLQEAARELRYRAFEEVLNSEKADRVALAHTANDQAEEVLIGLIRGAGLGGVAGMAMARGLIIRPLLRTYRPEILHYLAVNHIPYLEDASNQDLRYLRARVRHQLLPELIHYSPNIVAQLNRTADLLGKDEEYLQKMTDQTAPGLLTFSGSSAFLDREKLGGLPQALASRIIQRVIRMGRGHLRHIRAVHILTILRAARGLKEKGRIPLPDGWAAQWDRDMIAILPAGPDPKPADPFYYEIEKPQEVFLKEIGEWLSFRKVRAIAPFPQATDQNRQIWVDFEKVTWPLVIRNVRPGDRFQPLGLIGSKKVNRFLMDRKVPRDFRSRIPLVFSGGEMVCIPGLAIGHPFCLGSQSTQALEITCQREKGL